MKLSDHISRLTTFGLVVLILLLVVSSLSVPLALAGGETVCDETISLGTLDNVIVPSGESCTLEGSVVVEGNVKANGAVDVTIDGIEIGGNVEIEELTGVILIQETKIDGDISLEKITSDVDIVVTIAIQDSQVDGNITLEQSSLKGGFNVRRNTVGGNVAVENNAVRHFSIGSTVGGGNTIDGNVTIEDNTVARNISINGARGGIPSNISGNLKIANNVLAEFGLQIFSVNVDGNITVKKNTLGEITVFYGGLTLTDSTVDGNITVKDNTSVEPIFVGSRVLPLPDGRAFPGNTVGGNVTVKDNTSEKDIFVRDNAVDGNLKCKDNNPDPTVSGNNVGGNENCAD